MLKQLIFYNYSSIVLTPFISANLGEFRSNTTAIQQNCLKAKNSQTTFLHISLLLVGAFYYLSQR